MHVNTCSVAAAYKDPYWSEQYSPLDLIAEVDRQDADIIFKIVGKGIVAYYHPTDDPIFSAHKERKFTDVGSGNNHTFYYSDVRRSPNASRLSTEFAQFPISVVGCTEQVSCFARIPNVFQSNEILSLCSINFALRRTTAPS